MFVAVMGIWAKALQARLGSLKAYPICGETFLKLFLLLGGSHTRLSLSRYAQFSPE